MLARTQNAFQHVLTKPLICQSEHKMYFNLCWLNPSNVSGTPNVSQLVLTKLILRQGIHKMHLNTWWSKTSNASENKKSIDQAHPMSVKVLKAAHQVLMLARTQNVSPQVFDQTYPMPARKQTASLYVMTNTLVCQCEHLLYLNMWWPNSSYAREYIKCISTPDDQISNASENTKSINHPMSAKVLKAAVDASKDTNRISTCADQIHPMPVKTRNALQHVDSQSMPAKTQNSSQHVMLKHTPC